MKLKILFGLTVILCVNNLYTQEVVHDYGLAWNFKEGGKYYVYSDAANVRSAPDINSKIVSKLAAGQEVEVMPFEENDFGNSVTIDHFRGQWVEIKVDNEISGWIWSNTLSYKQLRRGNIKFVFGIDKVVNYRYKCTLKAIESGKIIDRKSYEIGFEENRFTDANIIDNVWLDNVKFVVRIYTSGEACGIGSNEIYFAWLDESKKLAELPKTTSVSDACVLSYSESLYIPSDNNSRISNLLLKVSAEAIIPDDDNDCDYKKWGWKYETKLFKWNGEKVVKVENYE